MIDIHTHILPRMDDGPSSLAESLRMCRLAYQDGITHIIATPHFVKGKYWPRGSKVSEAVRELQAVLSQEGIALTILAGSDIYIYSGLLNDLRNKAIPTINGTQYILLELPSTFYLSHILDFLTELRRENIIPIISHPERNPQIQNEHGILYQLVSNGAFVQVTALSITGGFGTKVKSIVELLLRQGLVHVIASDAHSAGRRAPILSRAVEEASKIVGSKQALDMVDTFPRSIIDGKPHAISQPSLRAKLFRRKGLSQNEGLLPSLPGRMFDILIQLGLLALIIFTPWFYGTTELWTQALAQIAVLSILGLWLIKGFFQKDFSLIKTALDIPIFTFLGLCLVYTFFSAYPQGSIFELNKILSCIMVYYIAVNTLRTPARRGFFLWAIILTALFYSGYGLLQYYGYLPSSFWTQEESLASRFINSSHFAGYIQLSIFLCIGMILHKGIFKKVFCGLICIVLLITLAYTRSRAVWVSFLVGGVFVVFLFTRFRLISSNYGFLLVFFSVICMFLIAIFSQDIITTRTKELFTTQFQSMSQRIDIWRSTWNLISDRPFGVGLGVFSVVYPRYRLHSDRFFVNYAHNEVLQIGAELGLLGLFILLWVVYRYNKAILKGMKFCFSRGSTERGILLISFAGGFTAIFIQSMVDFPIHIYAIAFLILFLLAMSMRQLFSSERNIRPNPRLRRIVIGLIMLGLPFYGVNLTKIYHADLSYRRGRELEKKFKWAQALEEYQKAVSLIPGNATYYGGVGSIYAQRAALSIDKRDYLMRAIEAYGAASGNSPYNAGYHKELAFLYNDNGEKQLAREEFEKAITLGPTDGSLRLGYGYFCLRNNMVDEGIKQLKRAQFLFHEDPTGNLAKILKECYRSTQDYSKLKEVIRDNAQSHLQLGRFLVTKGMKEEARGEFLRVLELDRTNRLARRALSRI